MMNQHIITALLSLICLGTICGVLAQRRQLTALRAEQQLIVSELATPAQDNSASAPEDSGATTPAHAPSNVSPELLRLRSEVNRLTARVRTLAGVTNEHSLLLAQMASSRTNNGTGVVLPRGYIRKAQAKLAGYNSPEDTLHSFLWALQNHDLTTLLQTLMPAMAQSMGIASQGETAERVFKDMAQLPGMAVLNRRTLPDGVVELEVQIAPGGPTEWLTFQLIEGQWKLSKPF
jgi:hypothetical protein